MELRIINRTLLICGDFAALIFEWPAKKLPIILEGRSIIHDLLSIMLTIQCVVPLIIEHIKIKLWIYFV